MLRNATPCLRRFAGFGGNSVTTRAFSAQEVKSAKEVSQAEGRGKSASEAPTKPSQWKGDQRAHLAVGVAGVLCAGILYTWVKGQNADKKLLGDTNHRGESNQFPAASHK